MMAMALGDGAVENARLIVMVSPVIDTVRKIPSGSGAVKTLYNQRAFSRLWCPPYNRAAMIEVAPKPVKEKYDPPSALTRNARAIG